METSDLPLLAHVSGPALHPEGGWAVVAVTTPNLDADAYVGQLWRIPIDGTGTPTRITRGFNDSAPRVSPDGAKIAFLRSDGEHPAQLQVMPSRGGEPVAVTDEKLGVSSFEWSPRSSSLAYTARVAQHGRYGTVKDLGSAAEPARRIGTRKYQYNGLGYTTDRRAHIFLVEAPDPAGEPTYRRAPSAENPTPEPHPKVPPARQLTDGDYDDGFPRFSPSGDQLGFISARHTGHDVDLVNNIYEISLRDVDSDPVAVLQESANFGIEGFAYSEDGEISFIGNQMGESGRDFVGRSGVIYRVDRENGHAHALTDPEISDFSEGAQGMKVTSTGSVLAVKRWRGRVELVSVSPSGQIDTVAGGNIVVEGFDTGSDHTVLSFHGPETHGDIGIIRHGTVNTLTDFSAPLVRAGIAPIVELVVTARDGQEIQGWVLTPHGEGPHPVLLNIHGGPHAQYTGSFFDEAQVYVKAGYAVVMCNPRGAAGYGETFARAIRHRMGTLDYTDVLDYLDGAIAANPTFDGTRLGIMGGSYGGYLTAWTISQDHRFAAAIVERGYLDPETFVGTSDIGDFFSDEYTGTDPEHIRTQSPQAFVHQVRTPTLIVHSEEDLRCPLSQAERYYLALKRHDVDTEMLIFPGENHELSRSGRPRHREQRFNAVLEWWNRYLPVSP